jgi:hypothetical protein
VYESVTRPVVIDQAHRSLAPAPTSLARLSAHARFVPANRLDGAPHICVNGRTDAGAMLKPSHWPGCATPPAFAALTATEIVARSLDHHPEGPEVDAYANNHFDIAGPRLGCWHPDGSPAGSRLAPGSVVEVITAFLAEDAERTSATLNLSSPHPSLTR